MTEQTNSSISIRARTSCADILEVSVLIEALGEFVLGSLLREELLETPLQLWWCTRELSVTRMRWKSGDTWRLWGWNRWKGLFPQCC